MNFKAVLALPKTAPSAQTYKSITFTWIVWSTLYVYFWTNPTSRNYVSSCDFFKINFNPLSTILNPMTKVISNGKSFPIWEDIKGLYPQMGTLMRLLQCTALIEQCSQRLFKKIGLFKYCTCHSSYKPESNKIISHWIHLKLIALTQLQRTFIQQSCAYLFGYFLFQDSEETIYNA